MPKRSIARVHCLRYVFLSKAHRLFLFLDQQTFVAKVSSTSGGGQVNHILSAKPLVSEPTPMLSTSSQNCLCMHHQKGQKLLRYYSFRARGGRERQHRLLIAVDCLPHISHFDNFASRWRLLLDPTLESGDFSLFPDMCTFVLRRTP